MIHTGDVIEHPVTGERVRFLETSETTGGERLLLEFHVQPHGFVAAEHVHIHQRERFEILSGTIRFRVAGVEQVAGAGAVVEVPAGTPHVWWNGGDEELHMHVSFEPALRTQEFFESYFAIAQQGRTDPKTGMPNLLQTAVLAHEFSDELRLASPPPAVQSLLFGALAALGRRVGFRARHTYPVAAGAVGV